MAFPFSILSPSGLKAKVGHFNWTTAAAGNTIAVTGLGFPPKAILFFTGNLSADNTVAAADAASSMGMASSPSARWGYSNFTDDGAATNDASKTSFDDAVLKIQSISAYTAALDLQSMDADGFTMVIDDAAPAAAEVYYLALGGSSLTDAAVGEITEPGATGNIDYTPYSFTPEAIIQFSAASLVALNSFDTNASFSAGFANALEQVAMMFSSQDAGGVGTTGSWWYKSRFLSNVTTGSAIAMWAQFVQFVTNGFRLNYLLRNNTRIMGVLGLKGVKSKIGSVQAPTANAGTVAVTGLGFKPKAIILYTFEHAEITITTVNQASNGYSIGFATGPADRVAFIRKDRDAADPMDDATATRSDMLGGSIATANNSTTIDVAFDLQSIDDDGFTIVADAQTGATRYFVYMALG